MNYFIFIIFALFIFVVVFIFKSLQFPAKIRKVEELIEDGEYARASEIIKKILDKKKDYVPARYIRAQLLMRQNQFLMAISELNSILTINDFNRFVKELDIHYHLAQLYSDVENWQKEIEEYMIILSFNSDDIQANHRIGHTLYKKNQYHKAKEYLNKSITLDPNLTDCYLPLGVSCYNLFDYEMAEQHLLRTLDILGDHTEAEYYLGSIYKMKKDYENAILMLDRSKKNNKFFTQSLYMLGEIYYEQSDYVKAIENLEQGLKNVKEKSDESYAYRYMLAECYELENKIKAAVHHWEKIVADNPDYRNVKMKLESFKDIIENENIMSTFTSTIEELQPMIVEMISSLQFNIVSKERITSNEFQYKAFNIKRINDPPILIYFNRTTREITEGQITTFYKKISQEKCKGGIYITTSNFSLRGKTSAASKMIELYDSKFVNRALEKFRPRK